MPHSGHLNADCNAGGQAEVTPPRVGVKILLPGMIGFGLIIMGIIFLASVFGTLTATGIIFLILGVLLVAFSVARCYTVRNQYQEQLAAVDHQHVGGGTTVVYDKPRTTPDIVQPQTPEASMTYGQPGMQPIIHTQTPEPANNLCRPGGEMYVHGAQTNIQPNVPRSPGASAPPQYPETDPEAPPPAYVEVVGQDTDPGNMGKD